MNYWLVSASYENNGSREDKTQYFLENNIWEVSKKDEKHTKNINSMKPGDFIAIKATYTRKKGDKIPFDNRGQVVSVMSIKALGKVTKNSNNGQTVEVEWQEHFESAKEWYFYTYQHPIWFLQKGDSWEKNELIDFVFNNQKQDINKFRNAPYWRERYGDDNLLNNQFPWTNFYEEISTALLDYKEDRQSLLKIVIEIAKKNNLNYLLGKDLQDICPFTVLGMFNRSMTAKNRTAIANDLANHLGIKEKAPTNFDAIPVLNNQKSWFFAFNEIRKADDIKNLWDFYEEVITYTQKTDENFDSFIKLFDRVSSQKNVAWNITMALFWMRPWNFVPLDTNSRNYIQNVLNLNIGRKCSGSEYLSLLELLIEKFQEENYPIHSFLDLSQSAWMMVNQENNRENDYTKFDGIALNQILYGPPGTGKTFATSWRALEICEPDIYNELYNTDYSWDEFYNDVKVEYDKLVSDGRIVFTTFHQSFAYEDFIEGLKANVDEETKAINYSVESGIFKELCETASSQTTLDSKEQITLDGRRIWKMSLGNTLTDDDSIYQECIENNYIALGYGNDIDFTGCDTKKAVRQKLSNETQQELKNNDYSLTSVNCLKNIIRIGDIIIVSDGNRKFRAIAEVTGDYVFLNSDERTGYQQLRPVKWHKVYEPSLSKEKLFKKSLSQMTLYELRPKTIDIDKLSELLNPKKASVTLKKPHVIIIDEINRGNISSIFGELITLIEPDKREGGEYCQKLVLPHSKTAFSIPDNVYIIGTMNTADRSLTQLDIALRRRFEFIEMMPKPELLNEQTVYDDEDNTNISLSSILNVINQRIEFLLDRDHTIGHSYFMKVETLKDLENVFKNKVIPLLQEYFYEDWERIRMVLNNQFITVNPLSASTLFPQDNNNSLQDQSKYSIDNKAFQNVESYKNIY